MPRNQPIDLDDVGADDVGGEDALDQVINFEDIKGNRVVPYSEYFLRVESGEAKLSKNSSQPKVTFRLSVLEGEHEGVTVFQDLSFAPTALGRTKKLLIGMGMPDNANWSPRQVARELRHVEFYGILDVEQSDGINPRTDQAYDPRNKLVSASLTPQTSG